MDAIYLKKFRKKTGLKQKEFALSSGLTLKSLRNYEQGKRKLTLEKYQEIKSHFGYLVENDSSRLQVMIDYVRITLKDVRDLEFFCRNFLHCAFKEFQPFESKLMNYNHLWKRGDIWIFDFADKHETGNFQITVQLSGRGCRQLELLMETEKFTWHDWLSYLRNSYRDDMNVTRFDIAIDEFISGVPIGEISRGLIVSKIDVYDGKNEYGSFQADRKWQLMFGGVEPLKFVTKPEAYSIERTLRWLSDSVSPSLAMIREYDMIVDGDYLQTILNSGEVNERGEKILDSIKASLGIL
ncbi:TPA: replication initiation factor domain-containing protein [Streptococcus agalactiae]